MNMSCIFVCIYMYTCIYICIHTCKHIYSCKRTRVVRMCVCNKGVCVSKCICMYVFFSICTCVRLLFTCMSTHTCISVHTSMYLCMCVRKCMYIRSYIRMYTCTYVFECSYIHMYTCTYVFYNNTSPRVESERAK